MKRITIFSIFFVVINLSFGQNIHSQYKIIVENGLKYYCSNDGKEKYRLAEKISELSSSIEALLLSEEIVVFPNQIFNFPQLKVLGLKNNQLETLPNEIDRMVNLEVIDLSKNELVVLPKNFTNLKKLKKLDLSFNPLYVLPKRFDSLENLEELYLEETFILSFSISKTSKIKKIALEIADFKSPYFKNLTTIEDFYYWNSMPQLSNEDDNAIGSIRSSESFLLEQANLKSLYLNYCDYRTFNLTLLCHHKSIEKLVLRNLMFALLSENIEIAAIETPQTKEYEIEEDQEPKERTQVEINAQNLKDSILYYEFETRLRVEVKKCMPKCELSLPFDQENRPQPVSRESCVYRNPDNPLLKMAQKDFEENPSNENKIKLTYLHTQCAIAQLVINDVEEAENQIQLAKKLDSSHFYIIIAEAILYFYQNRAQEGEILIQKWQDKIFDENSTFKIVFFAAINQITVIGIAPKEIQNKLERIKISLEK